jgi:hypothetical protein
MFTMIKMVAALLVGALGACALAVAPPAQADDIDYVMALDDAGVYYSSMSDVIDTGKLVCRSLRGGGSGLDAASGFNAAEARIVVRAARSNMCPDA